MSTVLKKHQMTAMLGGFVVISGASTNYDLAISLPIWRCLYLGGGWCPTHLFQVQGFPDLGMLEKGVLQFFIFFLVFSCSQPGGAFSKKKSRLESLKVFYHIYWVPLAFIWATGRLSYAGL